MEEVEVKYRLDGPRHRDALRARLRGMGARALPPQQEENLLLDDAAGRLRRQGCVLRLRVLDGGPGGVLTWKGPAVFEGGVKIRREVETPVGDAPATLAILEALGYRVALRYVKRREPWRLDGVEVALDALDVGLFCEVEGANRAEVEAMARRLGLEEARIEPRPYPDLVKQARSRRGPS